MAKVRPKGPTDPIWASRRADFVMPRGLPRPLFKGLPVPFSSGLKHDVSHGGETCYTEGPVVPAFSKLSDERHIECYDDFSCLVCGEAVDDDCVVVTAADREVVDGAPMHHRCGKLALVHCPHLAGGDYHLYEGPSSALRETWSAVRLVPTSFNPVD